MGKNGTEQIYAGTTTHGTDGIIISGNDFCVYSDQVWIGNTGVNTYVNGNLFFNGTINAQGETAGSYKVGKTDNYSVKTKLFKSNTLVFYKGLLVDVLDKDGNSTTGGESIDSIIPDIPATAGKVLTTTGDAKLEWAYIKKKFDVTMSGTVTVDMDGYYTRSGPYTGYKITDAAAYARAWRYCYYYNGKVYGPVSSVPSYAEASSDGFYIAYDDGKDYVINNGSFTYYTTTAATDKSVSVTLTGTSGEITLDGGSATNGNIAFTITGATAS